MKKIIQIEEIKNPIEDERKVRQLQNKLKNDLRPLFSDLKDITDENGYTAKLLKTVERTLSLHGIDLNVFYGDNHEN